MSSKTARRRLQYALNENSSPPTSVAMILMPDMIWGELRAWNDADMAEEVFEFVAKAGSAKIPNASLRVLAAGGTPPSRSGLQDIIACERLPLAFRAVNMWCARSMVVDTTTTWHLSSRNRRGGGAERGRNPQMARCK